MAVEDVQVLLDLLALSPEVTEISVQGASGNKITIKRRVAASESTLAGAFSSGGASDIIVQNDQITEPVPPSLSINATLVGLFHDANPPLLPGAGVVPGQIVGYVESMRLMNEVVSTVEGIVAGVVTSDGQPVEYGQPLFAITGR